MSSAQTYWRKGWKIGEGSRKIHAHRALIESGERAFRRHTGGWDTNSPGSAVSAVRRMDAALDFGVQKAFSSASDDLEARIARELAGSFGWKVPHATNEVDAFYSRFMDELGILTTREHNQREVSSVREKLNRTVGAIKAFGYNGLFFLATGIGGL
ncbi:hypothetical protein HYT84_01790, partial [Candidatus Micrarchaeota archaeon]|nr:hypothetical protein [Candidatus Micrarchaeota archaeon]